MSQFIGDLDLRDMGDGSRFKLLSALVYASEYLNTLVIVPAGFVTDLASIPLIGHHRTWSKAAVVHDYLYATNGITRGDADATLGEAMKVLKVPAWRRWIVISQLRLWGWKAWNEHRARDQKAV